MLLARIKDSVARRGILATLRAGFRELYYVYTAFQDSRFDRRYGTDTSGFTQLHNLTVLSHDLEEARYYQAISQRWFRRAMSAIGVDHKQFVFVDYGCGKGRALLLASEYPFKRIVGIEFAKELVDAAKQNARAFVQATGRSDNFDIVWMDARDFSPPEDNAILFLYNPFGEAVMREVLRKAEVTMRAGHYSIYVIYAFPVLSHVFDESELLTQVADIEGDLRLRLGCRIYTNVSVT